jgi:hypothetical protein
MKIPKSATAERPISWTFKSWPADVYPGDGLKARHVCRAHQAALIACGALTRPGTEIVIIGAGYQRWLASAPNIDRVANFDVPANRPEHAAKRFGRASETV